MKPALRHLARRYAAALRNYLRAGREAGLEKAYALGRSAIARGLGVLDLARIHLEARATLLGADAKRNTHRRRAKLAGAFFLEALSPFEATHRGFRAVNAELLARNRELRSEIAERRRAEKALRMSEERFRLLVSNVRDYAIILLGPDGRVASWNVGAERLYGYREHEILGRHFSCFYPSADSAGGRPRRELGIACRQGRFAEEHWRVRKDGSRFWANAVLTPVRDGSGRLRGFAKVVRDMTERKRAEEALKNLSSRILHAQEEERRRISRELHDEVGQSLTAISVTLAALRNNGAVKPPHFRRTLASTQRLLEGTMETVHEFARELRPALLDELGLLPALRSHVKNFSERTGLRVRFHADPAAERLTGEQKTALFRIAQESLTNVAKHARARHVKVWLRRVDAGLRMEIADDGKSFRAGPESAAKSKQRLGLLGMQERVRLVKGMFSIQPRPGLGTTVRVTLPFQCASAGGEAEAEQTTKSYGKN